MDCFSHFPPRAALEITTGDLGTKIVITVTDTKITFLQFFFICLILLHDFPLSVLSPELMLSGNGCEEKFAGLSSNAIISQQTTL